MPTLIQEAEIKIEWPDILGRTKHVKPKSANVRSSGIHLSGVNKYVLQTLGMLQPDDLTDEMPLRMAVGMAWEDWAVGLWPEMTWQPGEWERDDVFGTPDGYSVEAFPLIDEFKATWKSKYTYGTAENLIGVKGKLWMWQLMGNCYAMNANHARLHILWVNGDYRPPSPEYRTYLIEFSGKELKQYWNNIVLPNKPFAKKEEH